MPINRAPFNALVDDDGSNTKGTVWNKAQIQAVLLDPIDALVAPNQILGSGEGQNNQPGQNWWFQVIMPPLPPSASIRVHASFGQYSAAGGALYLYTNTGSIVQMDTLIPGAMANGTYGFYDILIKRTPLVDTSVTALTVAAGAYGNTFSGQVIYSPSLGLYTGMSWGGGGWTLGVLSNSQGAGGIQNFQWAVMRQS